MVDPEKGLWHLAVEWSGSFPLYYAHTSNGLLFCNRLNPLARVLGASPDVIAVREFLKELYMMAARSFFQGINRLMPGQSLTYDQNLNQIHLRETSELWVGIEDGTLVKPKHAASASWDLLMDAVRHCLDKKRATCLNDVRWMGFTNALCCDEKAFKPH